MTEYLVPVPIRDIYYRGCPDALFSYQPPLLRHPKTSWIVTSRALHTTNIFLTRVTTFPRCHGVYERYLASGQCFREWGKGAAHSKR
ncbi:hypothetical protein EV421DRAFT_1782247 [Armillaria borealis]|uniref:Uncharacterized protein n=1 Tax=Armillaria borealis TaxID=47425 RepID=A0AA39JV35_9AGAR|nr:hypothetical protein EV421DRAFT_1782247 [Armillaria borealis]